MTGEISGLVEGTVVKLTKYGAFVEFPDRRVGLVHVSEIANAYVSDIADYLRVGDTVKVRVLGVDQEGRYELSVKRAQADWGAVDARGGQPTEDPFEDKLKQFLRDSQERQSDLRRNTESKRGRSRRG
jgi:S1 RNA binding domain protein